MMDTIILKDLSLLLLGVYGVYIFKILRRFILKHESMFNFICFILFFILIITICNTQK